MKLAASERTHVAVVGGNAQRRGQFSHVLARGYAVSAFATVGEALAGTCATPPDMLLVDDDLPPEGGIGFIHVLRRQTGFREVPVLLTMAAGAGSGPVAAGSNIAVLRRPFRRSAMFAAMSSLRNRATEARWQTLPAPHGPALAATINLFQTMADALGRGQPPPFSAVGAACRPLVETVRQDGVRTMLAAVRRHDDYTYVHSLRTATLLAYLGRAMGLGEDDLLVLAAGGLLHDIGKCAVPSDLLAKPGALTPAERHAVERHVHHGLRLLREVEGLPAAAVTIVADHHERLDGTGYPRGLGGTRLHELSRLAAIVDVFGALTDERVYRPALPPDKALAIMRDEMRGKLDQHLLAKFRNALLSVAI